MRQRLRLPTAWRLREPHSGRSRIPFVQKCELKGFAGVRAGLICDLSVVGLYVAIEPVPDLGEVFSLRFALLSDDLPVAVDAVVTWRNPVEAHKITDLPPGCGLKFVGLDPRDLKRMESLVTAIAVGTPKIDHGH